MAKDERKASYYCEKHRRFSGVKDYIHEADFKLDLMKLVAVLECGCKIWVATVEINPEWLKKQK